MQSVGNIRVFVALAVVAVAGGVGYLALREPARKPSGEQTVARPAVKAEAPAAPVADAPPPTAGASDPGARSLLEAASKDPQLRQWLAQGDLLRRWALALDNVAEGVLQRRDLGFLTPDKPFAAVRTASGKLYLDPQSYLRWDAVADAIGSVDAPAFVHAVKTLHPLLEASWRALGYPGRSLDARAAQALQRLRDAPVLREPPELKLEPAGRLFLFADPALEALTPVEKLLLRMGPRNARLIQEKARQISVLLNYRHAALAESPQPR